MYKRNKDLDVIWEIINPPNPHIKTATLNSIQRKCKFFFLTCKVIAIIVADVTISNKQDIENGFNITTV
jgi:hypothetical protein